jgi:hypothetical protein
MSHWCEIIGTVIAWHTSECPDLLSVIDKFRFTTSVMISAYLLSQEEAGENVLCVEIDYTGDSQGWLPDYPYGYKYISLTA